MLDRKLLCLSKSNRNRLPIFATIQCFVFTFRRSEIVTKTFNDCPCASLKFPSACAEACQGTATLLTNTDHFGSVCVCVCVCVCVRVCVKFGFYKKSSCKDYRITVLFCSVLYSTFWAWLAPGVCWKIWWKKLQFFISTPINILIVRYHNFPYHSNSLSDPSRYNTVVLP